MTENKLLLRYYDPNHNTSSSSFSRRFSFVQYCFSPTAGSGYKNFRERSYAMIYVPVGREFTVKKEALDASEIKAWWYNPRTGKATYFGTYKNDTDKVYMSPTPGESIDWILVLNDASRKYPVPVKRNTSRLGNNARILFSYRYSHAIPGVDIKRLFRVTLGYDRDA